MNSFKKPQLIPLSKGEEFQLLKVMADAGAAMPTHHATSEAVVMVKKGEAEIKFSDRKVLLKEGDTFIIPKNVKHRLEVKEEFEAVIALTVDGAIAF